MAVDALDIEIAGLDALEAALGSRPGRARRLWSQLWPKLAAIAIALLLWQCVVWSHHWPEYLLPGPRKVFPELWRQMAAAWPDYDSYQQQTERDIPVVVLERA